MKNRFILFQRSGVFYCEDTTTGKQTSLRTRDKADAVRLLHVKNEATHQPSMNLQIAQVYLQHGDPAMSTRTWQMVMEQIVTTKHGNTQARWQSAIKDKAMDVLRHRKLIETLPEHFLAALQAGAVATNVYLRRIHHFAVAMHWLPWPVLPKLHWPPIVFQHKRAITLDEHRKLIAHEPDAVRRAYYELLWYFGGSQTDMARLTAEDIDWKRLTVSYRALQDRHAGGTGHRAGSGRYFADTADRRIFVPDAGGSFAQRPGPILCLSVEKAGHQRRDPPQLPLRLGGTCEGSRLSRTICHAGARPCEQSRASCVCKTGGSGIATAGRI